MKLSNRKIAVLATDGFEQSELDEPVKAVTEAGGTTEIVSLRKGRIRSWAESNWGHEYEVDKAIDEASAEDYDGLVLPGGVMSPDKLRVNQQAVKFVKSFIEQGKPIAAICHGPWTLIETGLIKGRHMTSYPSIRTDLVNAGVSWTDEKVVTDNGLVTSRSPEDLPAFCRKMIEEFSEGKHQPK